MKTRQAQQMLAALAAGHDPDTGEELPEGGPFNTARLVRAFHLAAVALQRAAAREERPPPGKAGRAWSDQEDHELSAAFDTGTPLRALALAHQRSTGAIKSRLVRLGRLPVA